MKQPKFQSKFKRGVSLIHQFDKSLCYSVQCDCGENECSSIVEIECDDDFGFIQLHFYKDVYFDFWRYSDEGILNSIKRFLYRWKKAFVLAFTGEISLHGDFIIMQPEHINNFIEALQEGRDYCVKAKEEMLKENNPPQGGSGVPPKLEELNRRMMEKA